LSAIFSDKVDPVGREKVKEERERWERKSPPECAE
jgi:hypothetical protein